MPWRWRKARASERCMEQEDKGPNGKERLPKIVFSARTRRETSGKKRDRSCSARWATRRSREREPRGVRASRIFTVSRAGFQGVSGWMQVSTSGMYSVVHDRSGVAARVNARVAARVAQMGMQLGLIILWLLRSTSTEYGVRRCTLHALHERERERPLFVPESA